MEIIYDIVAAGGIVFLFVFFVIFLMVIHEKIEMIMPQNYSSSRIVITTVLLIALVASAVIVGIKVLEHRAERAVIEAEQSIDGYIDRGGMR